MNNRVAFCCFAALSVPFLACRDVSPGATASGPNFSVVNDAGPGGCDATHCRFNTRGVAGIVNWYDPGVSGNEAGGGVLQYGFLSVGTSASQVFLYYGVTECAPPYYTCNTVAGGYGTIPLADFSANAKSVHVSTNTSGNPYFFTYAGPTGVITADFVNNGLFSQQFSGTTQRDQPGLHEHITGQSLDASAQVIGNLVGFNIPAANYAQISSAHTVQIDINH